MVDVPGPEAGRVVVEPDGTVRCALSFPSQGQGHATAVAQLVADRLGVPLDCVRLLPVDTAAGPAGSGTFGSRGAVAMGGSAVDDGSRVAGVCGALIGLPTWVPVSHAGKRWIGRDSQDRIRVGQSGA